MLTLNEAEKREREKKRKKEKKKVRTGRGVLFGQKLAKKMKTNASCSPN